MRITDLKIFVPHFTFSSLKRMSRALSAPFFLFNSILNDYLSQENISAHYPRERSIGIMHSHSETAYAHSANNPCKKRSLRSRSLCNVKAEGWSSSSDDVSISTEINRELRSAGVVVQSSHRRKARSASGARPSISSPPCRWCVTDTCINLAHSNAYLVPCYLPTTPAPFVPRDIEHKSRDYRVGRRATRLIKIARLRE